MFKEGDKVKIIKPGSVNLGKTGKVSLIKPLGTKTAIIVLIPNRAIPGEYFPEELELIEAAKGE